MTYTLIPELPEHIQNFNRQGMLIKGLHWYLDNGNIYIEETLIEHGIKHGFKSLEHIKLLNTFKNKNIY